MKRLYGWMGMAVLVGATTQRLRLDQMSAGASRRTGVLLSDSALHPDFQSKHPG